MSALDELLKDIPQGYDEIDVANHLVDWREPAAAELLALRERVAKLEESVKAAQVELQATQRNWDEECLFECNDILTAALKSQ